MKSAREFVPRMLPLPQPELQDILLPLPGPVEPTIAFATNQRREPFDYDVGEAGQAEKLNDQDQASKGNSPVHFVQGNWRSCHHFWHLLLAGSSFFALRSFTIKRAEGPIRSSGPFEIPDSYR